MSSKLSNLKQKAIDLRQKGYSYGYIKKTLKLKSKGTISYWLKNIKLTKIAKKLLARNNELATKRGLHLFNKIRTEKINQENKNYYNFGYNMFLSTKGNTDLLLLGTALYWCEGTKSIKNKNNSRLSFANSDPKIIVIFMRFLREVLCISDLKIMAGIHLYPDTNIENAKNFWSSLTKISANRFYIIKQVSRTGQNLRKNILQYGTIHIRVNSRVIYFKMLGLIDGLIKKHTHESKRRVNSNDRP